MNRLLVRRCSMSSIEEEDEPSTSEDLTTIQMDQQKSRSNMNLSERQRSPSLPDWDSEVSESEQEFDDNDDDFFENGEEKAANRVLQNFMQTASRTRPMINNDSNGSYSPLSLHLYDDEDSAELDAIISELRDFKIQFEECSHTLPSTSRSASMKKFHPIFSSTTTTTSTTTSTTTNLVPMNSTTGCVSELRTLEDQLEAALASLTFTINDCPINDLDGQQGQRSSDSSACSSGLGDDITTESTHPSTTINQFLYSSKTITSITDDCDSAFSDSGSTEKMASPHPEESVATVRSIVQISNVTKEAKSIVVDQEESLVSQSQHPSKLLVRTYNDDGSTKSILVDDAMSIRDVIFVLVHKNHREPDVDYALVEVLPDLHMERTFEDHQKITEAILMWPTVSSNRLLFTKRTEKYSVFRSTTPFMTRDETMLVYDELLKTPDIEGIIYLKEKSRKSWKKHFCVLRSSGLYFVPKGKSKKDLVCLAKFENVELFFGLGWKKKFKSPSDYCFALKHPLIQKKSSKYIKYMCVETKDEFDRWINSIRIAKFGQQLKLNYLLMEKAMNIYRSSGRFAAVCAARSSTPKERKGPSDTSDQQSNSPTPCPSIRDRQVLNRTPITHSSSPPLPPPPSSPPSTVPAPNSLYHPHSMSNHLSTSPNPTSSPEELNDENSPIKSASYMDELRQRLERVLNDPASNSSSSVVQQSSLSSDRHPSLSVSKSFRLPPPQTSSQLPSPSNNTNPRSNPLSRVPLKSSNIRGPTLIAPPKIKTSSSPSPCLNSTENLRPNPEPQPHPILIGSTPLPRKQFQPSERNLSYRSSQQAYPTHPQPPPQQMSKSFIIPTKREEHRSASSLSVASKTDSMSLDENEISSFADEPPKTISPMKTKTLPAPSISSVARSKLPSSIAPPASLKKPSLTFRTNSRVQASLPVKTPTVAPPAKIPQSISQTGLLNKSLAPSTSNNALNHSSHPVKPPTSIATKPVPPVPPRKSSIPRPSINGTTSLGLKPQPPPRDSSNHHHQHLLSTQLKAHISHL